MTVKNRRGLLLALLLGGLFLAAQVHFCIDLNSSGMDSHICPVCSMAGTAVATQTVKIAVAPTVDRQEIQHEIREVSLVVTRDKSPRAPPAA